MAILFKNNFIEVRYEPNEHIVVGSWQDTDKETFTDSVFRECMLQWFEEVKKIGNVNVLADARKFLFTIGLNTQTWINENIIGLYPLHGVTKLGFLVSADLIAQISIEQTIEEKQQKFQVRYFSDLAEATQWLSKSIPQQ